MTDYEHEFSQWLHRVNLDSIPNGVVAFVFNLSEGDNTFGVQFTGTSEFSVDDQDWACEEIFCPAGNFIDFPYQLVNGNWVGALELVSGWARKLLQTVPEGDVLKQVRGVAVGFVDGDLEVICSASLSDTEVPVIC